MRVTVAHRAAPLERRPFEDSGVSFLKQGKPVRRTDVSQIRLFAFLLLVGTFATASRAAESVEIVRDQWGVANVYAENEEALFYGAGYAMAGDRLLQMMLIRCESEGRLAELFGPGEEDRFIQSDKTYRLLGFDRHARKGPHARSRRRAECRPDSWCLLRQSVRLHGAE